jgi:tetratricopeptide (TPR) repeat protein
MSSDLEQLKAACVRLVGAGLRGTGYVVAPERVATCWHVVKTWKKDERYALFIGSDQEQREAWLIRADEANDAAIVAFDGKVPAAPLPLATSFARRAVCDGYGYPMLAKEAGVPFDGEVLDPNAQDQDKRPAVQIYSRMVAAGQASPLHGFSGSPVAVDGAVIGHLTRHLGDPDDLTRASYGIVYACPVDAVRKLLDVQLVDRDIGGEVPLGTSPKDYVQPLPAGDYHVFLSYRSTDRDKAKALTARMEGTGYRVFYDQQELKPGDVLVGQLQAGLSRSRCGVILVSRGWVESPWCQEEGGYLAKRAIEDKSFRLIPVRLDDCELPFFLANRLWIDLQGVEIDTLSWSVSTDQSVQRSPFATRLEELLWAISGKVPPPAASTARRLLEAEADATQEFLARIMAAAQTGPERVKRIWREWEQSRLADQAPALLAAETLIGQANPHGALQILEKVSEQQLRARQLRALALRKCGFVNEAIEILEELWQEGQSDPETGGILAGSYKARWRDLNDRAALPRACELYRVTWERTGDPYNGINAAATALWLGDRDYARDTAVLVRTKIEDIPEDKRDHWAWATLGEADLTTNRIDAAHVAYRRAVAQAPARTENIAAMRIQARLDLKYLNLDPSGLDATLPVPSVVAFFGHMTDLPGRPRERFPSQKVGAVRNAIRAKLAQLGAVHGFSSAARGSDILFVEEVLRGGGQATVILPYPVETYLKTSLGGDWDRRFKELENRVKLEVLDTQPPTPDRLPEVLAESNRAIQKRVADYGRLLGEDPLVIAVWDGQPGDGPGGTADAVALWKDDGYNVDVIDITKI